MRPKRYPYSGKEKQPRNEIAKLKGEVSTLKVVIAQVRTELLYRITNISPDSVTEYPADFSSDKSSSKGIS